MLLRYLIEYLKFISYVGAITGFFLGTQNCYREFLTGFQTVKDTNTIFRKIVVLLMILVVYMVSFAVIGPLIPVIYLYKVYLKHSLLNMGR